MPNPGLPMRFLKNSI